MELRQRDIDILNLVRQFTQLSSTHLTELVFRDRSHTVPDRVLRRLVRLGYLARAGRRATGDNGGAGAFVYQLGRHGRLLLDLDGRASMAVNDHALMIADTYLELHRAARTSVLRLARFEVELPVPPVRADLFARVDFPDQQRTSSYFLEIDLGTEATKRLIEKISGYWRAAASSAEDYFPYVVFVVKHQPRLVEIRRLITKLPEDQREMVTVTLLRDLIPHLMRL